MADLASKHSSPTLSTPLPQALLLGGASIATSLPRAPDVLRLSKPGMDDAIIQHFASVQQFTDIAHSALKSARRQLMNQPDRDQRALGRIDYLLDAVDVRKAELATQAGSGIDNMKLAVLRSKAWQLHLCTERALANLARGGDGQDGMTEIGRAESQEDLATMMNEGTEENSKTDKPGAASDHASDDQDNQEWESASDRSSDEQADEGYEGSDEDAYSDAEQRSTHRRPK